MAKSSFYTRILNIADYIDSSNIESVKKRLFDKSMPEPNTGCVIWCGCIFRGGYGRMWVRDKQIMSHRISYFVYNGEIPKDFVVDHLCNNPSCINPLHLEAKIQRDNGLRATKSLTTINALKTHCNKGHEFTPENTYWNNGRTCIICATERKKVHYLKNKERYSEKHKTDEWKAKNKEWRIKRYNENKDLINKKRRLSKKLKNG